MQSIIFITDMSKKFCSNFFNFYYFHFLLKFHTCTALKHMMSMYLNTDYELRIKTEYKVHIPCKCSNKKKKPVYTDHLLISELK